MKKKTSDEGENYFKKSLKLVCFQLKSFHPDADVAADTCADFLDDSRTSVELKIGEIAAARLPNDLSENSCKFFLFALKIMLQAQKFDLFNQ